MNKFIVLIFCLISVSAAAKIREIRIKTADCSDCGMTFLGELSAKVSQ